MGYNCIPFMIWKYYYQFYEDCRPHSLDSQIFYNINKYQLRHPHMKNQDPQFDLTRSDKRYSVSIPSYATIDNVVLYEVRLKDLIHNKQYIHQFRFKELKQYHQNLTDLKLQLPQFPKTHFWKKTNKNPQLIEDRRTKLASYFGIVVNDPFTRGYSVIKKFIKICKLQQSVINRTKSANSLNYKIKKPIRQKSLQLNQGSIKITFSSPKAK